MEKLLTTLAAEYPIPAWLASIGFVVLAVHAFVGIIIKVYKFVDRTNGYSQSLEQVGEKFELLDEKNSRSFEKVEEKLQSLDNKYSRSFEKVEEKLQSLDNKYSQSFEKVEEKFQLLDGRHSKLLEKFNSLITTLAEKNSLDNPDLFSANSPISLTPNAVQLLDDIGWKQSLENESNKQALFDLLDKFKLKTKYDVEKYSIVLLTELAGERDDNPYTPVKKYLYENAKLDDFQVMTACAIYLRDRYLENHPEIED